MFSQGKVQFKRAVDLVVGAQTSGDVQNDVTAREILRMAHDIAVRSQGVPEARERMLAVMLDGLRAVD
jgi:hypothetical protein